MSSAFISYSRQDQAVAKFVASTLKNHGIKIFIDTEHMRGNFVTKIGQEIEKTEYFVILIRVLLQIMGQILSDNTVFNDVEITHKFETLGMRTMLLNARPLITAAGLAPLILLGIEDITHLK